MVKDFYAQGEPVSSGILKTGKLFPGSLERDCLIK
jgi:hypothetical protein